MRRSSLLRHLRRILRLSAVPALVSLVVVEAATLSSHIPFGGRTGVAALGAPFLYPVWLVFGLAVLYAIARYLFYRFRLPHRAVWSALTLAAIITATVLSIDVGCGVALQEQARENPDLDVPSYAYLANESLWYGRDNTLTHLAQAAERACAVYNVPFEGTRATGYGLAPTETPTAYHTDGAFGKAQYTANGLLAEGYVFSLDVALAVLDTYYSSRQTLADTLEAYNREAGAAYADVDEALEAIRREARPVYSAHLADAAERGDGAKNRGTLAANPCQTTDDSLSADQIHALLVALATDMGNSALLEAFAPLLALGDVPLEQITCAIMGEEAGAAIVTRYDLAEVCLRLQTDPLSLCISGSSFGDGVILLLGEAFDETPLTAALHTAPEEESDYPLSSLLARAICTSYRRSSPSATPLFAYYADTAPTGSSDVVFAFLDAATMHDFALYEGNTHGQAVSACLLGEDLGDGTLPASAGLSALEVRTLRWQLRHLTPILSLLVARNALLYFGGLAVLFSFLADRLGRKPHRARAHAARAHYARTHRPRRTKVLSVLAFSGLLLPIVAGWAIRWGVMPAVSARSYGVLDPAAIAASPSVFARSIRREEGKYMLFAMLSGALDPTLAYERLTEWEDGAFCNKTLQNLYLQAIESAQNVENEAQSALYDLVWQYYVRPDPRYSMALTDATDASRRALARAVTAYIYPIWCQYTQKGVRSSRGTPVDTLFAMQYQTMVEEGYRPLEHSDALYLVLEGRPSLTALLHLALDNPRSTVGALDVYGEPILLAEWEIEALIAELDDFPSLLEEVSALASEDLRLPYTHRAVDDMVGGSLRLVFCAEEGRLAVWLYPSAYLDGGVGYVQGTLIKYKYPLYVWGYSLPFVYFALLFAPFGAILAGLTIRGVSRHPRRAKRPLGTQPPPPRGA